MAQHTPAPHDPHAVAVAHHDAHAHDHHDVSEDRAPAYVGLVASALVLLALIFGMVKWTNGRYAHESKAEGATPAAEHK